MISIHDIYKDIHLLHIFQPICIILGILCGYKLWITSCAMNLHMIFVFNIILILLICYIFKQRLLQRLILYILLGYCVFQSRIYVVNFHKAYTPKQMLITANIADINEYKDRNMLYILNLNNIQAIDDNPNIVLPKNARGFICNDIELLPNNIQKKTWSGMNAKRQYDYKTSKMIDVIGIKKQNMSIANETIQTHPSRHTIHHDANQHTIAAKVQQNTNEQTSVHIIPNVASQEIASTLQMLSPNTKIVCQVDVVPIARKDCPADYPARFHAYFNNNTVNFDIKAIQVHHQQQAIGFAHIRSRLLRRLARLHSSDLAQALLLGARNNLSHEHREVFQRLGIYHILSISGMHLSIVSFIGYCIGYLLYILISLLGSCISEKRRMSILQQYPSIILFLPPNPHTYSKITGVLLCIAYTILTGASIPTIRACIMYLLGLFIFFADYNTSLLHTLILACSGILCIYPESIFSVSFQFSFIAMYVITLLPQIQSLVKNKLQIKNKYLNYIVQSSIICIIMSIYTTPLSMYHFQQFTLQPILGNLIAIPYIVFIILPTLIIYSLLPIACLLRIEFQILEKILNILDYTTISYCTNHVSTIGLLCLLLLLPFAHSRTKLFRIHLLSGLICMLIILFPPEKPIMLLDKFGNIGYTKDNILYTTCAIDSYTANKWRQYFHAEQIVQFKHETNQELFGYYILYPNDKSNYVDLEERAMNIIDVSKCMRSGGLTVYKSRVEKMNEEKFEQMNIYLW